MGPDHLQTEQILVAKHVCIEPGFKHLIIDFGHTKFRQALPVIFVTKDKHVRGMGGPFREHPLLPGWIKVQSEPQVVIGKPGQRSTMTGPEGFFQITGRPVPGPDGPGMGQQSGVVENPGIRQGRVSGAFFHTGRYTPGHIGNG
jgi:hypothetical protein